jgi:hypothetical protein
MPSTYPPTYSSTHLNHGQTHLSHTAQSDLQLVLAFAVFCLKPRTGQHKLKLGVRAVGSPANVVYRSELGSSNRKSSRRLHLSAQ